MPQIQSNINILEIKGKRLIVSETHKEKLGKFQAIGRINSMYSKKETNLDIFNLLDQVSKPAYSLFNQLKSNRNPTNNISFIKTSQMNKSQKTMFSSRILELKKQNIIKKAFTIDRTKPIQKGSYIINPNLILCPGHQEEALRIWDYLK